MEERAVADNRQKKKKSSQLKEIWRRYRKNKAAVLGLIILVLIIEAISAKIRVRLARG